ncbi:hypothetical protein R69658_07876 [Paraburkholderia aspalathi]|uniref:Uncharacterized protein n=1 Tax=Paraburkholderia aspalathi TaxID=1324617 RepID=A0ABM8T8R5_9BURK|nr:hypothetical protein [Paraburkholderia aspalathi]MBK3823911.1 hypothetical protein [Paraburkholderia aspalathi]MBK3835974.1 hypothetical protein [Paraburkholderia aspalathi]MBK3844136.1 hypothetical protein [Paraburkholderia aspalathi]MBK3865525.1 hypothetical protein [Paraburkholderia aspalathi]CAE6866213.1 hypothetical protein R69658_07876 [Paraburkholderia aspalathi]
MNLKHAAIMAVVELETKLHFDLDHDSVRTLTQPDCDSARASVFATGHLLPPIVHNTLLLRIAVVECWLAGRGAEG